MPSRTAIAAALLCVGACTSATAPEAAFDPAFFTVPTEVILRVGDEVRVPGTLLRVVFARVVEDSRCPVDVTCVWEGNALIEVGMAMGSGPTVALRINTTVEPTAADWNGLRVTIVELLPVPRAADPPAPDGYTVRLRIEATG